MLHAGELKLASIAVKDWAWQTYDINTLQPPPITAIPTLVAEPTNVTLF
jgi:hypothetical protein